MIHLQVDYLSDEVNPCFLLFQSKITQAMKKGSDIQQKLDKVLEEEQSLAEESHKLKEELKVKSKDQKGQEVSGASLSIPPWVTLLTNNHKLGLEMYSHLRKCRLEASLHQMNVSSCI